MGNRGKTLRKAEKSRSEVRKMEKCAFHYRMQDITFVAMLSAIWFEWFVKLHWT